MVSFHVCVSVVSYVFDVFPRNVQRILLTGKSSHKCRNGTRKKSKTPVNTNATTMQIALFLHFHLLLFCFSLQFVWSCIVAIARLKAEGSWETAKEMTQSIS